MDEYFLKEWTDVFVPTSALAKDITVSSFGPSFHGCLPVKNSLYAYPYSILKGPSIALASFIKKGVHKVPLAYTPAFVHSQWSRGYYHWLTESLPRALSAVKEFPDCVVLLPKTYNAFHKETLDMLGIKYDYFPEHNIKVERGIITSCPNHYGTTSSSSLFNVRNKLISKTDLDVSFGRRLYISRRKARGRKVINESEVIDLLSKFGFEEIVPEDYTFEEQVSIFSQADFLVGIHGAGLTNMLFMKEGSSVIELLPYRNGIFDFRVNSLTCKHDNCYISLAKGLGLHYGFLQCGHDKGRYSKTHMSNLYVDCSQLLHMLN